LKRCISTEYNIMWKRKFVTAPQFWEIGSKTWSQQVRWCNDRLRSHILFSVAATSSDYYYYC